jgi:hypothetical protein
MIMVVVRPLHFGFCSSLATNKKAAAAAAASGEQEQAVARQWQMVAS